MEVSVACAVRVPEGCTRMDDARIEQRTFWNERAITAGGVRGVRRNKCEKIKRKRRVNKRMFTHMDKRMYVK